MNQEAESDSSKRPTYVATRKSNWEQISQSRSLVLCILFFATGSLGLPILWKSPVFTLSGKWFWSIVVTIYTVLLVVITVAVVWWAYSMILNAAI